MSRVLSFILLSSVLAACGQESLTSVGGPSERLRSDRSTTDRPTPRRSGEAIEELRSRLRAGRYGIRTEGGALVADNPTARVSAKWDLDGVALGMPESDTVTLRLAGYGRGAALLPAAPGEFKTGACARDAAPDEQADCVRRVEARQGYLTEWWVNRPDGLEQGFTIDQRMPGEGEFVLALDVGGGQAVPDGEGAALLIPEAGEALAYSGLVAWDATDRALPTRMEVADKSILLVVDDTDAVFPVTVDPLVTGTLHWTYQPTDASARVGDVVSAAGDVNGDGFADWLVVASGLGSVRVFHGAASGLSTTPVLDITGMGSVAAGAGDVNGDGYSDLVIGSPDVGITVFLGSAAGLQLEGAWSLSAPAGAGGFGTSVASAGDIDGDGFSDLLVGAPGVDKVFVFRGSASGLVPAGALEGDAGSGFGKAIASAGDVNSDGFADVLVGAPDYGTARGKAWLFLGSAGGLSTTAAWTYVGAADNALTGTAVTGLGDMNADGIADFAIGAPGTGTAGNRVLIFMGVQGAAPAAAPTVTAVRPGYAPYGNTTGWGSSLSGGDVNGDGYPEVIVGSTSSRMVLAVAYVTYKIDWGSGRIGDPAMMVLGGRTGIGTTAAFVGDVNGDGYGDVLVGDPDYSAGRGAAYLFRGSAPSMYFSAVGLEGGTSAAQFGSSVASAGDVNGDGYEDVLVGAPDYGNGQATEGRAFLFLGGPGGFDTTPDWTFESDVAGARLGLRLSGAGDVNGDGYDDILVGAPELTSELTKQGRVYLFYGRPDFSTATASTPDWTYAGDVANANLGSAVSGAGDVNGDGYADFVIGASGYSGTGAAYVFHGSPSGPTSQSWTYSGTASGGKFGDAAAAAGDVNGDGFDDVIIGAPAVTSNRGQAFVFFGSASGLRTDNVWTYSPTQTMQAGTSVAGAGDVNGDGYADVLVGAPNASGGGSAFLFRGSATGLPSASNATMNIGYSGTKFGYSVSRAGDVNGDGFADVIVGGPDFSSAMWGSYGTGEYYDGSVRLYLGTATGLTGSDFVTGAFNYEYMGRSVAGMDVNGDGFGDIVVGSPGQKQAKVILGGTYEPEVSVSPTYKLGVPTALAAMAVRPGTGTRIAPGGLASAGFDVRVLLNSVLPGEARVQVEVKPARAAFDATGLVSGAWTATSGSNAPTEATASVTGLSSGTDYQWRARIQSRPSQGGAVHTSRWVYGGRPGEARSIHVRTGGNAGSTPVVPANISATTLEDTPVQIELSATGGSGTYTYSVVGTPSGGAVANVAGGKPTFTPPQDQSGTFTFRFKANDGTTDSNTGTVTITVTPVNDAPTAHPQTVQTNENTPVAITLTATDPDNVSLTYQVISSPQHGTLSGNAPNVTYTPNANWFGTDTFTFTASDGSLTSQPATITIQVAEVNDAPVAQDQTLTVPQGIARPIGLVATDADGDALTYAVVSQPQHGTLVCNGADCTYTSQADYVGADSFTFKANDGTSDSNVATVTLNVIVVQPGNLAPVAHDLTLSTELDTPRAIALTASDPNGDALTYSIVRAPEWGTLSALEANLVTYTPLASFDGADTFQFKVSDGELESNAATVTIAVGSCRDDAELCVMPPPADRKATCFVAGRSGRFMREVGQTFVVSKSGRPGRVRLPASQLDVFDPAARLLVDVRFTDSAGQIRRDEAATVAMGSVRAASLPALRPEFVEFVLHSNGTDASAVLQPGQKYALVLRVEGEANFGLGCSNEDAYPDGQAFTRMARQIAEGQFGDAVFVGDKRDLTFSLTLEDGVVN